MIGATLAAESEKQPAVAYELYVAVLQCREAIAVVVARILVVADSKPGRVEQADDDGEHFFSRQAGQREIPAEPQPQSRQRFAEFDHALELRTIA